MSFCLNVEPVGKDFNGSCFLGLIAELGRGRKV